MTKDHNLSSDFNSEDENRSVLQSLSQINNGKKHETFRKKR